MDTERRDGVADEPWLGEVRAIYAAEGAGVEMHALLAARLLAGVGVEGDRYALGTGHYSHLWHPDRQLTLISQEVIDGLAHTLGEPVDGVELRRNIVTKGVPLNSLVERCFEIGETVVYGGRLNVPCRYLERLIDKPVFEPLLGQSGLNCRILRGGTIRQGDPIRPLRPGQDVGLQIPVAEPAETGGGAT